MTTVGIPAWTALGVLPPVNSGLPTNPVDRSPYKVTVSDFVMRFATTSERRAVLKGFLAYRSLVYSLGYVSGFQWLDGSFLEDIETTEKRAPRDVDVVTFFHDVAGPELSNEQLNMLSKEYAKDHYKVDAYYVELDLLPRRELTAWSTYWYSMWSHRRNHVWKGYLQIELMPTEDIAALALLEQIGIAGDLL
jgi:hypothetical protein